MMESQLQSSLLILICTHFDITRYISWKHSLVRSVICTPGVRSHILHSWWLFPLVGDEPGGGHREEAAAGQGEEEDEELVRVWVIRHHHLDTCSHHHYLHRYRGLDTHRIENTQGAVWEGFCQTDAAENKVDVGSREEAVGLLIEKHMISRYLLNIPYDQSSAKLPVTQLLGHSVTWSIDHFVTWSLGHSTTQSLSQDFFGKGGAHGGTISEHLHKLYVIQIHPCTWFFTTFLLERPQF